jgi:hypothetical protein
MPLGAPADAEHAPRARNAQHVEQASHLKTEPLAWTQGFVDRRPWPAVGAAAGAGIVVGAFVDRAPVAAAARSALSTAVGIAMRIVLVALLERFSEPRRSGR